MKYRWEIVGNSMNSKIKTIKNFIERTTGNN